MAFDEQLAGRVRTALGGRRELAEAPMFGGLAFLYRGHVVCAVVEDELMVRLAPKDADAALAREGARPMDGSDAASKGMLLVRNEGIRTRHRLERWVRDSLTFVSTHEEKRANQRHRESRKRG